MMSEMRQAGLSSTISEARSILGKQMILPDEIEAHYRRNGVSYSKRQCDKLQKVPFSQSLLERVKLTHALLPGYPISVRYMLDEIRVPAWKYDLNDDRFWIESKRPEQSRFEKYEFYRKPVACRWLLMPIAGPIPACPNPCYTNRRWPSARDILYVLTRYNALRGHVAFWGKLIASRDRMPGHIVVMGFTSLRSVAITAHLWWDLGPSVHYFPAPHLS